MQTFNFDSIRLETPRLILRVHHKDDLEERVALWRDPDVVRHIGNFARSREDVWDRMLFLIGHWQVNGFGYWAVEDKESGKLIGEVGFMDAKREIDLPFNNDFEGGWILDPHYQGKGLAFEAMHAAQNWLDQHFAKPTCFCIINPENEASLKLAERLGYRFHTKSFYKDTTVNVLLRANV